MTHTIYPCIWFNGQAKEAAEFYCSVFQNSGITGSSPMVVNFELDGQKFMALDGGPEFRINPSISFYAVCETESEIEAVWSKLSYAGFVLMPLDKYDWSEKYGWVQDRFGLSWQISLGKLSDVGQKISPFLMFTGRQHGRAEAAIQFYSSIFQPSSVTGILRYGEGENGTAFTVKHAQFSINNFVMMVIDSSYPHPFNFNEAVSLVLECDNQEEIDFYWAKLGEDGKESMCGWLRDQFGVWWQVVPSILGSLMSDPERAPKVAKAFLQMKKFDIQKLLDS